MEPLQETYDKNEGNDIKRVVYVKVHASDRVLFEYAEHLQIKKLLKVRELGFITFMIFHGKQNSKIHQRRDREKPISSIRPLFHCIVHF